MTKYKLFLLIFLPFNLLAVTIVWALNGRKCTWKQMFRYMWEAE